MLWKIEPKALTGKGNSRIFAQISLRKATPSHRKNNYANPLSTENRTSRGSKTEKYKKPWCTRLEDLTRALRVVRATKAQRVRKRY
jgi:hypothetical protein